MEHLTEDEISEIHEALNLFDKDGEGGITLEELVAAATISSPGLDPTEEEPLGTDGNGGALEFWEFLRLVAAKIKRDEEEELKEAFKVFDDDQDGYISAHELRNVMICLGEKLSDAEVEQMIRVADRDGDGQVNFDEFAQMMMAV